MEEILKKIEYELVPRINEHHAAQQSPLPQLELNFANNNENIPLGLVEHQSDKWSISDMYRMANPHPATQVPPYRVNVTNVSKFLQTTQWPECQNQMNKCQKRTLVHKPDLAVIYKEPATTVPANRFPYRVPILIIKIEGSKDMWGAGEQETKVLEEASSTLAFMPDTYVVFVYGNRFEFCYLERNPFDGSIDCTSYPIYVQHSGEDPFRESLKKVVENLGGILVRQIVRNGNIIRQSIIEYRNANLQAYRNPRRGQGTFCCPNCWVLPHPFSATAHCTQYANNQAMLPQFE